MQLIALLGFVGVTVGALLAGVSAFGANGVGYLNYLIGLLGPLLLGGMLWQVKNNFGTKLFFLLVLFFLAWPLVWYLFSSDVYLSEALQWRYVVLATFVFYFSLGYFLPVTSAFFSAFVIGLAIVGLLVFLNYQHYILLDSYFNYGVLRTFSYQSYARSYFMIFCLVVLFSRGWLIKLLFSCAGLIVLYQIGARAEFYGFIALLLALGVAFLFLEGRYIKVGLALVVALVALFYLLNYQPWFFESRHLEIFRLQESSSWLARKYLSSFAIGEIFESPLWGAFGSHYAIGAGAYAHNILSIWVDYGLVGFLGYIGFIVYLLARMFGIGKAGIKVGCLLLVVFLLLCVLKNGLWPIAGFALGLAAGQLRQRRVVVDCTRPYV